MYNGKSVRPRGTDSAKVISVIETRSLRGRGTSDDPCREVIQYWDFEGNLLAENDPQAKEECSGTVTTGELECDSIRTERIAPSEIVTARIDCGNTRSEKIASGTVTSDKINDHGIRREQLAPDTDRNQ